MKFLQPSGDPLFIIALNSCDKLRLQTPDAVIEGQRTMRTLSLLSILTLLLAGCQPSETKVDPSADEPVIAQTLEISEADLDNLVRRSYQYVAMYNVNNKFARTQGGWNTCVADKTLKDHTARDIARPNNDTLYAACLLDLSNQAIVLEIPTFDSNYVSLMITGYDHYVNIPMASRLGDFQKPERMLIYTTRSPGYSGEPIEGIDRMFEATGDFVSVVFRVMPHAYDTERFERILAQLQSVTIEPLAQYQGAEPEPAVAINFPDIGQTDADIFENNLLEVMQFVFNHTTFDPNDSTDQAVLAAYAPLGLVPGTEYDPDQVAQLDGERLREKAQQVQREWLTRLTDRTISTQLQPRQFQPKGKTDLEALLAVSIIGPIGIPQEEAVYPQVATADGEQMNAMHDYVISMSADELPPAEAFWSLTLYDLDQGFFLPNDRKKYSVGENAGMKLNEDGGIDIYIAAEQPDGVPVENWLPIERQDLDLSPQLRIYVPDLDEMKTWKAPVAEIVAGS
jgi:hypothetical protein